MRPFSRWAVSYLAASWAFVVAACGDLPVVRPENLQDSIEQCDYESKRAAREELQRQFGSHDREINRNRLQAEDMRQRQLNYAFCLENYLGADAGSINCQFYDLRAVDIFEALKGSQQGKRYHFQCDTDDENGFIDVLVTKEFYFD
ncbi:TPA: hypothetical protein HA241_00105 [Candidatus Woesearchaeota archaeon]|nr:hypothetical protein [Candidatus Woesearchaeota archaeon]